MLFGRFTFWIIKEIINRAEEEYYSPEAIRRGLAQIQFLLDNKEITIEEYREHERKLINRLKEGQERGFDNEMVP